MAIGPPAGAVIDLYREQVSSANVQQAPTITAGGVQGTNTATLSSVTGLYVGDAVTLTGGTAESLTVQSIVALVVTFTTNIVNTGHTGATWGYASPVSDDFYQNAVKPQSPFNTGGTLCPAYLTQQTRDSWQAQLRQANIQN